MKTAAARQLFPNPPGSAGVASRAVAGGEVARGKTEAEAFQKLLDVASRDRFGSFDSIVLPHGQKP
jgi:hypothetical protein